jgi:poly(3-hydroxybutyrate) depolymerase
MLDVWAPANVDGAPVLILLDGLTPDRERTAEMAAAPAARGYVVLNADWQSHSSDGVVNLNTSGAFHAACVVRFARAHAGEFGGDPEAVTVIGYSAGGSWAALLALNGDAVTGQCSEAASVSAAPDAFVGLGGGFEYLVIGSPEVGVGAGVFDADPALWEMMNPYQHLDDAAGTKGAADPR